MYQGYISNDLVLIQRHRWNRGTRIWEGTVFVHHNPPQYPLYSLFNEFKTSKVPEEEREVVGDKPSIIHRDQVR